MTYRLLPVSILLLVAFVPSYGQQTPAKLPMCGLPPAKLLPNQCLLKYRVTTSSPECQAFVDQGLGYFYSYVWMEAARSFETATLKDPDCAMAWWCLSRALDRYGKGAVQNDALKKAQALMSKASHREQMLITARLEEKGIAAGVGDADARKKAAIKTIDTLLALYEDDEEGWYYRAQLSGGQGLFGGIVSAVPYYKALLKVNPLHPGANHELVHFYENFKRPALGWQYAEAYIKSSPGIPHSYHMQAHLGTRVGRWEQTTEWSSIGIKLQKEYHKTMNVKPAQDHQFNHHLEILMLALTHDGRFTEARALKKEAEGYGIKHQMPWFRLHLAERNYDDALKVATTFKGRDKTQLSYLKALVYLRKGDTALAAAEVNVLRQAYQDKRDKQAEIRLWETQGMLLCQQGEADAGLKLLKKAVDKTANEFSHHAWGNGAYYMELWGISALQCGKLDVAEEAFLEALAHDAGCVRAAMGLQILCERQGRSAEASRYDALAHRCWAKADPKHFQAEVAAIRGDGTIKATAGEQ